METALRELVVVLSKRDNGATDYTSEGYRVAIHDEAEKRLGDPRDRILEATRDVTFDPGTPWFPSWLPLPLRAIWCVGGLVTVTIRYTLRVWWPVLLLAVVLTASYS